MFERGIQIRLIFVEYLMPKIKFKVFSVCILFELFGGIFMYFAQSLYCMSLCVQGFKNRYDCLI